MPFSRFTLLLVVASCALLGAAAPSTASSAGLNVMVTGNCSPGADLASAIQAQPGIASVTTFDTGASTPTAADLAAEDLVVDLGHTCNGYLDPATYGDRLANYVDHGGTVLQAAYDNWDDPTSHPTGRFASGGYAPLSLGPAGNISTTLGQILKPNSPIVQGLGTFSTGDNTTTPLAPGATLLAKWADGRNAIAVKGRVVATSASAHDIATLPDLARLARNTAKYFNAVPSTKITDTRIDTGRGTARFRFKAIGVSLGFVCELKKSGAKPIFSLCLLHASYSQLKPGLYLFEVVAVGPGGADPTPARRRFRIIS